MLEAIIEQIRTFWCSKLGAIYQIGNLIFIELTFFFFEPELDFTERLVNV